MFVEAPAVFSGIFIPIATCCGASITQLWRGVDHETDLPTEQTRAQAPPRIPCADGHQRRPQGHCRKTRTRPQAPFSIAPAKTAQRAGKVERLKTRSAFRAAATGHRVSRQGFVLQALKTGNDRRSPRFGFTVTKKIGNAAVRNRIRRRLKEAVRLAGVERGEADTDYVLIGRRAALSLEFDRLITDLMTGMSAVSKRDAQQQKRPRTPGDG